MNITFLKDQAAAINFFFWLLCILFLQYKNKQNAV